MAGIITLTTDFGIRDAYVAAMKGVILSINPRAIIVDVCHSIEPQNIVEAAFIISTAYNYFPTGTIHLVVVDPGVGSQRKAIIMKTRSAFFLAPDNGVLSYIVAEASATPVKESPYPTPKPELQKLDPAIRAIAITNPHFWLQPISPTFHGRDVFAPVAAHLSLGTPLSKFGKKVTRIYTFPIPRPYRDSEGNITGCVLHIDALGNLITNIKSGDLPSDQISISINSHHVQGLSLFYAQSKGLTALIGSSGYLEIAFVGGNAASVLNAKTGDKVKVSPRTPWQT
jgi:S-adenosylmethionine hydrolase